MIEGSRGTCINHSAKRAGAFIACSAFAVLTAIAGPATAQTPSTFSEASAADAIGTIAGGYADPSLATDGNANWVAVWSSDDDLGGIVGDDNDILVSTSSDNGVTWSTPLPLNNNAASDSADDSAPSVATDGSVWVAAWSSDGATNVATSTDSGASWADAASLGAGSDPAVDVDASTGGWVVVAAADGDIAVSNSDGGSATLDSGSADGNPDVGSNDAGSWLAAFEAGGDIGVASSANGSSWSATQLIGTNGPDAGPRVANDGLGNWVVVWSTDSGVVMSVSSDGGSAWSPALAISDGAGSSVSVATDGDGSWVAVWSADNGDNSDVVYSTSDDNGLTWAGAESASGNSAGNDENPDVATDSHGQWIAIWESADALSGNFVRDILFATGTTTTTVSFNVAGTSFALPDSGDTVDIILADFNGDGRCDIYEVNSDAVDQLTLNPFTAASIPVTGSGAGGAAGAAGDFDGDGDNDVIIAVPAGNNRLLINDGAGNFTVSTPFGANSNDVAVGDLDGDGIEDLVVFANATDAVFTGSEADPPVFTPQTALVDAGNSQGVAIGDVDGDGELDVFLANSGSPNTLHLGDGLGGFTLDASQTGLAGDSNASNDAAIGNLNGAGTNDVYVANTTADQIWTGSPLAVTDTVNPNASNQVVLADLDSDGDLDAIVATTSGVFWFINDGSGVFQSADPSLGNPLNNVNTTAVAICDFDGDGVLDIFVSGNGAGATTGFGGTATGGGPGFDDDDDDGPCFIASAAYGTPMAKDIEVLREMRDTYMMNNALGLFFVDAYYQVSPVIADQVAQHPWVASIVRALLTPVLFVVELFLRAPVPFLLMGIFGAAMMVRRVARRRTA